VHGGRPFQVPRTVCQNRNVKLRDVAVGMVTALRDQPPATLSSLDRRPKLRLALRFSGTAVASRAPVAPVRVLA